MNQMETMGRRIAALRKERKMTQDALAQELGVSPQAVSKWEHDLSCPDIGLLPKLARVLGVSTDYLLDGGEDALLPGGAGQQRDEEDERPGIHVEASGGNRFDIRYEPPRHYSFSGAAWLICVAALMMAGPLLKLEHIGFWSACWISGLLVWGVGGLLRRMRLSNVLMTLAGVYLAAEELGLLHLDLGWDLLFPGLILLMGLCLLFEGMGKKRRRASGIHITGPDRISSSELYVKEGFLYCTSAFAENHYRVQTPELKGGDVSVCFGEHVLDFSGVEQVAENCRIEVNTSFGETVLKIPSRYRAELTVGKSFAQAEVYGHPDPEPEGVIYISANVSFGELSVKYI